MESSQLAAAPAQGHTHSGPNHTSDSAPSASVPWLFHPSPTKSLVQLFEILHTSINEAFSTPMVSKSCRKWWSRIRENQQNIRDLKLRQTSTLDFHNTERTCPFIFIFMLLFTKRFPPSWGWRYLQSMWYHVIVMWWVAWRVVLYIQAGRSHRWPSLSPDVSILTSILLCNGILLYCNSILT